MITENSSVGVEHLRAAVDIAASVSSLPAVATQDWCSRAASALRQVRPQAVVSATLAVLGARGSIVQMEATGAVGTDPTGRPLDGEFVHPDHAPSLDWWLESDLSPPSTDTAAALSDLACHARWRDCPAGRRWGRLGVSDLIVGVATIPGSIRGRVFAVEIGVTTDAPPTAGEVEVVRASLRLLARRALLAFGTERSTALSRLTSREQQVLDHLALGKSVKEIATDLGRSPHTVHDHVKSLHRKLQATSRGELIARALGHLAAGGRRLGTSGSAAVAVEPTPAAFAAPPTLMSA